MRVTRDPEAQASPISVQGSKNVFLSIITAAFASQGAEFAVSNVPQTSDRMVVQRLLGGVGLDVADQNGTLTVTGMARSPTIEPELGGRLRQTISYAAALAANLGAADACMPGGDAFTPRPIDIHLRAVIAAGGGFARSADSRLLRIEFPTGPRRFDVSLQTQYGPDPAAPVGSLGATVTALHVAALCRGKSVIRCAPAEPEVEAVIDVLRDFGVEIQWSGPTTITVVGVDGPLCGAVRTRMPPDRIEAGTYILAGLLVRPQVELVGIAPADFPEGFVAALAKAGVALGPSGRTRRSVLATLSGAPRPISLRTEPHPGYPTDLQPPLSAFLSQAHGSSCLEETMYASRATHVPELLQIGLRIRSEGRLFLVPGRQAVGGGNARVRDIRCGAALLVAAAAAKDGVVLSDPAGHLARGYSTMDTKLRALGLQVERAAAA